MKTTFVPLAAMGLIASVALAQNTIPPTQNEPLAKGKALVEMTWTTSGTHEWNRPENVRYVLVRACGGGGGGGGGYSIFPKPKPQGDAGTAAGGGGGAGSSVSTILLGPLTAARYNIVIGRGGNGGRSTNRKAKQEGTRGEAGTATSFSGPDLSFETPGSEGGHAGALQTRISTEANVYLYVVSRTRSSTGAYPGGGSAQTGARGLLGLGGTGDVQGDSGGGGGSVGKGGNGGGVSGAGIDGGTCAGGGGAGFPQDEHDSSAGGRGGDGSLTLLSLSSAGGSP
jgi:hypothetical protein